MKTKTGVETTYIYVGDGLGIPGLPHEITMREAEAQGIGGLLAACIEHKIYIEKPVEQAAGKE